MPVLRLDRVTTALAYRRSQPNQEIDRNRLQDKIKKGLRFLKENPGGSLNLRNRATRIGIRNVSASDRIHTAPSCHQGLVALGSRRPEIVSPF
jgi:hypothetical protein